MQYLLYNHHASTCFKTSYVAYPSGNILITAQLQGLTFLASISESYLQRPDHSPSFSLSSTNAAFGFRWLNLFARLKRCALFLAASSCCCFASFRTSFSRRSETSK